MWSYGCGGIKAALENQEHGLIDNWLRHVKDVIRFNARLFEGFEHDRILGLLCEFNLKDQVKNICNTTVVKNVWKQGKTLLYTAASTVLKMVF